MNNYPLGDMLIRIKNAYLSRKDKVLLPSSKIKEIVVELLKKEGFVSSFKLVKKGPKSDLIINLKYKKDKGKLVPAVRNIKLVSKPGRRVYVSHNKIPYVFSGIGINILSTNRGILTGQEAKNNHLGGELICQIW